MRRRSFNRTLLPILAILLGGSVVVPETARAQESDEIIERIVVRNRKHSVWNTVEIAPTVGVSLVNRMTQQLNLQLGVGFNFSEEWGLDVRGGWTFGDLTSVGKAAQQHRQSKTELELVDEFQDLWRLKWHAMLMPRWSPIYGKLNLLTELPLHFQAYVTAGGGLAGLEMESVVYCQSGGADNCDGFVVEERQSFLIAAGLGFRFFVAQGFGLRIELMDVMYPDERRTGFDMRAALAEQPGTPPGEGTITASGLTNVLFLNVGATVNF